MSNAPTLVPPRNHAGGHDHHHHDHGAGHVHAPAARQVHRAAVPPSLLRASLAQRLAVAVPVAILLWVLAMWVIQGGAA